MNMDISKVVKDAFGIADWVLEMLVPWWGKAKVLLVQAVGMVETVYGTEKGDVKRQKAIDLFEKKVIEEGLIPKGIEEAIDPVLDWGLEWAINALVKYLNEKFGKDWIKFIAPSKVSS